MSKKNTDKNEKGLEKIISRIKEIAAEQNPKIELEITVETTEEYIMRTEKNIPKRHKI